MDTMLSNGTFDILRRGTGALPAFQNHLAAAGDVYRTPHHDRELAFPRYRVGRVSDDKTGLAPISQFEQIASTAARISVRRMKLLPDQPVPKSLTHLAVGTATKAKAIS